MISAGAVVGSRNLQILKELAVVGKRRPVSGVLGSYKKKSNKQQKHQPRSAAAEVPARLRVHVEPQRLQTVAVF